MPSFDLSLKARLMNAGMSAGNAQDVANTIAVAPITGSAITGSTIDGTSIGATTPSTVKTSNLQAGVFTDISGTPGAGTSSGTRGRAAFAIGASTIVVTSTLVAATSSIFVQLEGTPDATLTSVLSVTPGAGSFTVTGNTTATAAVKFSFLVVN